MINSRASVADMKRHLRREPERFVCYGGYKSFYLDWNFDLWRCDAWDKRLCSIWEFAETPLVRDGCTACMADCYRDSSVMLHFAVSLGDAIDRLGEGRVRAALRTLADGRNLTSLAAYQKRVRSLTACQARLVFMSVVNDVGSDEGRVLARPGSMRRLSSPRRNSTSDRKTQARMEEQTMQCGC